MPFVTFFSAFPEVATFFADACTNLEPDLLISFFSAFRFLLASERIFFVLFRSDWAFLWFVKAVASFGLSVLIVFVRIEIAEPLPDIASPIFEKDSYFDFSLSIAFSAFSVGILASVSYNSRSLLFNSCTESLQSIAEL